MYSRVKRQSLPEAHFNPKKTLKRYSVDQTTFQATGIAMDGKLIVCLAQWCDRTTLLVLIPHAIPTNYRQVWQYQAPAGQWEVTHIYTHIYIYTHIDLCLYVLFKSTISRTAPTGSTAPCCFGQGLRCAGSKRKASHVCSKPRGALPAISQHLSFCVGRN